MLRDLRRLRLPSVGLAVGLLALVAWCYWSILRHMAEIWSKEATYSHGYLVPVFALVILWLRRESIGPTAFQPSWWAVPLVLGAAVLRLAGSFFYYAWLAQLSLLPAVAARAVRGGGRARPTPR